MFFSFYTKILLLSENTADYFKGLPHTLILLKGRLIWDHYHTTTPEKKWVPLPVSKES